MIIKAITYLIFISLLALTPFQLFQNTYSEDELPQVFIHSSDDSLWIENTLAKMTLKEKCAQMVFPFAKSRDIYDDPKDYSRVVELVQNLKVGGLIFFQGDVEAQARLTNEMQALSDIPLLIASDFERGLGMRLDDAVEFPFSMAFAAAGDARLSYYFGKVVAQEGRALGVHQNFAPLLDINHDYRNPIINVRSYSENVGIITMHSNAFLQGMHESGMLTTAKHFPGHGATDLDSHIELPLISLSREELINDDLVPFQDAFNLGVKSVMIGHLDVPAFEDVDGIPATFSKKIVTELLQNQMQFYGLIVTDAMNMKAITDNYTQQEAAQKAVLAGNDIILFPSEEYEAVEGLYEGVQNGMISENRIDYSVRKILAAKKWLQLDADKYIDIDELKNVLNKKSHWRLAEEVAQKSITVVKDDRQTIPINPDKYYSTALIELLDTRSRSVIREERTFEKKVKEEFGYLKTYTLSLRSYKSHYSQAFEAARKSDLILLPIYVNARSFFGTVQIDENHLKFIQDVASLGKPTVIISFGNPYVLTDFPEVPTYICAYGNAHVSQKAAVDAVLGRFDIAGKLPVSIPNTQFALGHGIEIKRNEIYIPKYDPDTNYSFQQIDSLMESGIEEKIFPGGVLLIGHRGKAVYHKSFGHFKYDSNSPLMSTKSIFDLASLTKVAAATSAAMILYDQGKLGLNKTVVEYLPEFNNNGKEKITIHNLLTHTSGLPAWKPFYKKYQTAGEVIDDIMNSQLDFNPGTEYKYSDLGMITLQKVIEKISGEPLDIFLDENLFNRIGMKRTMFNPPAKLWFECVPTEIDNYGRMTTVKGKVHDETAFLLDGVAGHAGLFSTAGDLAKLIQIYLDNGMYKDQQIFKQETIDLFTSRAGSNSSRALGWDTKSEGKSSAGTKFSHDSFGHTGFTGTSIWVDKEQELFVILLTNRVHPSRENNKLSGFRPKLHDAVIDAVDYFPQK
ncbi:MAG: serine hydrolase [Melioribacteraceae bacterium]|nr:serine hydrolase [Melioribacteraceae bacterium]MCF8356328.1 serine hydrolase [Melioribacteraceae bacterium]MCF8395729.1 serine hydrolase [Melioribacteraceae bacterium]MCF8420880.1 serine hydrolase [Melioribacteraceae bacterium]